MEQATIQEVLEVKDHTNADALELVTILGWQVVVKKGEFNVGDKVVYVGLDSILPPEPEFEFLSKNKYRINTAKLRGEMSYGICFPLSVYTRVSGNSSDILDIGDDVTEAMGVGKYEKPLPKCSDAKGGFPTTIIRKADEERVQNIPEIIDQIGDGEIYITVKADGSSITVLKVDGELMVCSRNLLLKEPEEGTRSDFWDAVYKYGLVDIPDGVYIQAELIGGSIQGNPHGIQGLEIRVFNGGTVARGHGQTSWGLDQLTSFCEDKELPMAELVYRGKKNFGGIDDLVEIANSVKYENGAMGEGIVVRYTEPDFNFKMQKPTSFKIISPKYALKHGE